MGKNKVTTLLVACLTIMLCTATIVGGTYALWSDTVTTTNHLAAGKLEVTLTRTGLVKHMLGSDGRMTDVTDTNSVEIADDANFFGIESGELIAPTASYAAKLKLANSGSVAVNYSVNITLKDTSDSDLASQLKVYIGTIDDQGRVAYDNGKTLAECQDGYSVCSESLNVNAYVEFWVKVEFVNNDAINNDAQSQQASFDLVVVANQKVD